MDSKALFKLTYGLYVVGAENEGRLGGCVVDAVMQTTVTPNALVLCCCKGGWTSRALRETKDFSLSVLPEDADPFTIANFGFQSSLNVDKWDRVAHKTVANLPVLEHNAAYLICRVTDFKELSTHILFFCDILDASNGNAKALSYTEYQESWKPRVMDAFKAGAQPAAVKSTAKGEKKMAKWVCKVCNYEYDGDVPFEDLPDDYVCPVCGVGKDEFEKAEEEPAAAKPAAAAPKKAAQWVCKVCGYVYDGDIPFEDLPDDYVCPVCGVGKDQFEQE